ncbi:hypothetical protein FKM82_015901 [Ascaphus truei]|uniref:galectin-6-like isoform X2 n=1 Tax=Ascaphus truei TaxID=8439 RepID=UPI003F5A5C2F
MCVTLFEVQFSTGQSEGSDIAFHMNACFDGHNRVVFNSYQGGRWGDEEMKEMPIKHGDLFSLLVEVTEKNYQVIVNGSPFYQFTHRLSPGQVQHLQVDGDITVHGLSISSKCSELCPMSQQ